MKTQIRPRRPVAHSMVSFSYICTVNSGNAAPSVYLRSPFAAIADAPLSGPYISRKYTAAEMKIVTFPNANGTLARTGEIQ